MVKSENPNYLIDSRGKKQEQLRSLLEYPGETPGVDYKSSEPFDGQSDFSLKIIKHVLGMANAGGGFIVIGFPEGDDSKPRRDLNITPEIASTYEATRFPQMVAKKIRDTSTIDIVVHHIDFEGKSYPILEIGEFINTPIFCKSDCPGSDGKLILRQGALYLRTDKTNTEEISKPEEWEKLIQISMRKRNDELLERFSKLLEQVQSGITPKNKKKESRKMPNWFSEQRKIAEKVMEDNDFEKKYFEVVSYLPKNRLLWSHSQLLEAMTKAVLRNTGWPQGVVLYMNEYKPKSIKDGIQATIVSKQNFVSVDHWGLSRMGDYYFCRTYHEDFIESKKISTLSFDTRIWRIAEAIDHTFSLYSQLNIDPKEVIYLEITHKGLKDRYLSADNPGRAFTLWNRASTEDIAIWKSRTTLDEIKINRKVYITEAIKAVVIYFDFFEPEQSVIDSIVDEYDNSRL